MVVCIVTATHHFHVCLLHNPCLLQGVKTQSAEVQRQLTSLVTVDTVIQQAHQSFTQLNRQERNWDFMF